MSMSRYLTKQRVSAPNSIDVSQINVGINDLSRPSMSKIIQRRMKDISGKSQSTSILGQKKGVEHDQSSIRATLGEMILQKNLTRQASSMPNRSSGSRCTLFASNNQDDRQDDMRVEAYDEEDDDEDIDQLMITNGVSEMEGGDDEESIHHDDQSLSSEYEDELELEQFDDLHPKKGAKTNDKIRGPTMMHHVHMRPLEKREVIIYNEFGQPIGPITSEKDTVGEFSRFLGTIARDYSYAPLIHKSWHKVPHKDKMWEYALEKYMVPDEAKNWVLRTIGASWRGHKCRVKEKYFYKLKDNKSRWKNRPKQIPDADFMQLLALWNKKEEKIRCSLAKERRKSQKNMHTAGPKSFARIYEEMKNTDLNKEPPSLAQMFEQTRKRKEGRVYVDTYDDTAKKIEAMKNYISPEDGKGSTDPFLGVMPKEYDGYRRLYGRGVTNKMWKKVNGSGSSYMVSEEFLESLKANVEVEKRQLLDMRKEIEEDHERKKAELQEMKKDLESQHEKLLQDAVQKILEKLPLGIVREYLI